MRTFTDRVAVVTGAGSGIGRALSLELARRGCHLAIQDVSGDRLTEVAAAIEGMGRRVVVDAFDVSDAAAMQAFAGRVRDALGGAHIVVNNAGVSLSVDFAEGSLEDWEWIVGINFWGVVHGCHAFLPQLREQDEAHIVNLSSLFGIIGVPSQSAYCATKFAVRGLSESLHLELMDTAVGVTCVHPGAIATNIVRDSRYLADEARRPGANRIIDRGMRPERAAEHIADAIRDNRPRLVLGRDAQWLDRVARAIPTRYRALVHWFATRQRRKAASA